MHKYTYRALNDSYRCNRYNTHAVNPINKQIQRLTTKTNVYACNYIFHETTIVKSQHASSENVYTILFSRTFPDFRY